MAKFLDETGLAKLVSLIKGYAVPLTGGTITGDLTVEGKTTVQAPTEDTDAATKAYVDEAVEGAAYELPIASSETLGGIKVGDNLTITEDGVLSATSTGGGEGDYLPLSGGTMTGGITLSDMNGAITGTCSVGGGKLVDIESTGYGVALETRTRGSMAGAHLISNSSGAALLCSSTSSGSAVEIQTSGIGKEYGLYISATEAAGTALRIRVNTLGNKEAKAIEVTGGDTDLGGGLTVSKASTFNGAVTVPTPTEDTHAATKAYVDAAVSPKILTAEPTADDLEEGEVAFVVEE